MVGFLNTAPQLMLGGQYECITTYRQRAELRSSSRFRPNRKSTDEQVIRMNSVGISLATIASIIGCHPATISLRLKQLNIPPADTRRAFMEDIIVTLSDDQQEWLVNQLGPHISVKDFVRNLIVEEYVRTNGTKKP